MEKEGCNKETVEKGEARTNGNGEEREKERIMERKNNCKNEGRKKKMSEEKGEWKLLSPTLPFHQ